MDPPKYSTVSIKLKSIDPCVCFSRNWLHTRQTISPEFLEQSWLENNLNLNISSSWLNQHNFPSCSTVHCTLNIFSKFFKRWIYWFQFFLFCEAVHLDLFFCLILFFINLLFYVPKTGGRGGMPRYGYGYKRKKKETNKIICMKCQTKKVPNFCLAVHANISCSASVRFSFSI